MIIATLQPPPRTLADLVRKLGDIPLHRIRFPAGNATENDVIRFLDGDEKKTYELIDGVLVEKPMGLKESILAGFIGRILGNFVDEHDLGVVFMPDGPVRIRPGRVLFPDTGFIPWSRIPGEVIPDAPITDIVPTLSVEVISEGNTVKEMESKLKDYFSAGVKLVWYVYPKTKTALVFYVANAAQRTWHRRFARRRPSRPRLFVAAQEGVRAFDAQEKIVRRVSGGSMARKSKKNPAYRTKEQLVKDVTIVLNSPVTYGTKQVACRQAASEWTEHDGKYKGCCLWSKKAVERYESSASKKNLRHEHAVPKKVVVSKLLSLPNPTETDVGLWFKFLLGVVVTIEEDKLLNLQFKSSMPPEFYDPNSPSALDMLLRYKKCEIEIVPGKW